MNICSNLTTQETPVRIPVQEDFSLQPTSPSISKTGTWPCAGWTNIIVCESGCGLVEGVNGQFYLTVNATIVPSLAVVLVLGLKLV